MMHVADRITWLLKGIATALVSGWLAMSGFASLVLGTLLAWNVVAVGELHWNWMVVAVLLWAFGASIGWVLLVRSPSAPG